MAATEPREPDVPETASAAGAAAAPGSADGAGAASEAGAASGTGRPSGASGSSGAARHAAVGAGAPSDGAGESGAAHGSGAAANSGPAAGAPDASDRASDAAAPRPPLQIGFVDVLCVGPILARIVYSYATIPIGPSLLGTNPVLLEFLRGSIPAMVTAGSFARVGRVSLFLVLLAPLLITMFADPFTWWAGRRYGRRILDYYSRQNPRYRRSIARGEGLFRRFGVWTLIVQYFQPIPNDFFYVAAGETRMPFLRFIIYDTIGTLLWIGFCVGVGWALGQTAVDAAETISRYAWPVTIALVVGVMATSMWRQRRGRRSR